MNWKECCATNGRNWIVLISASLSPVGKSLNWNSTVLWHRSLLVCGVAESQPYARKCLKRAVCVELLRRMKYATQELFYLRENRSYEVDFAVVDQGHVTELVQVTYDFSNPSTKLYNREVGGLLKGAAATRSRNLTLVIMQGEQRDIQVGEYTVRCVPVTNWMLKR